MSSLPSIHWILSFLQKSSLFGFPTGFFLSPQKEIEDASNSALTEAHAILTTAFFKDAPPPSYLEPKCHPLEAQVTKEVDRYFIQHWPFSDDRAAQKFRAAGFSRVTCCYFPEAHDDRIEFACRLLTLLFLIDGL